MNTEGSKKKREEKILASWCTSMLSEFTNFIY
jgi:hypothetical protein